MENQVALSLIADTIAYLKSNSDACLAEAEDYNYFRQILKKAPPQPKIVPQKAFVPPPPAVEIIPEVKAPPPPAVIAKPVVKEVVIPEVEVVRPKVNISGWKNLFSKVAPQLSIIADIPSDAIAKKINTRWKTKNQIAPISILLYQEIPEQKALLEQIAKAIDVYFGPAKIVFAEQIEKEKQWEAFLGAPELGHIVCCDYSLWQLSNLMKFYKEIPATKTRQLGNKPLFLLPDLSLYVKDPQLKKSLWKALCQTLSTQQSS